MDTYKHSCAFCGQHIEYTADYCGKQMVCPSCGKTVTFPAVPPGGKRQPLRLKRAVVQRSSKWSFNFGAILTALREFEHWNVALTAVVPFLIIVGLLVGAHLVRVNFGEGPSAPAPTRVVAAPGAWQKSVALARADQAVREVLAAVQQDHAAVAMAQARNATLHATYGKQSLDPLAAESVNRQYAAADQAVASAQAALSAARQAFQRALTNYQGLGGTIDYSQQLPQ